MKLTEYILILFFGIFSGSFAHAASSVYYSVGQNTTSHETGSGTVTVSGNTAIFSVAQTATNMGVGDVLDYDTDNKKCYISGKTSTTVWSCTNATGGAPTAATNATVNSIAHAFASLSAALPSGAGGAKTLLGNSDLTAIDVQLNIPCYYDTGADTNGVTIDGWTTDATRYIKVYTPTSIIGEVNSNQRHNGKWDIGKYRLQVMNFWGFNTKEDYVRFDGLQISVTSSSSNGNNGIYINGITSGNNEIWMSNLILRGIMTGTSNSNDAIYASVNSNNTKIWNNVIYGWQVDGYDNMGIYIANGTSYIYNNTVYGNNTGIRIINATIILKNNISYNNGYNYFGTFDASSINNLSGPSQTDAPGSNPRNAATVSFVSTTAGSEDFHLLSTDVGAKNYGANLSSDPNLPFSTDIDGQGRTVDAWDIGADEYSPSGNFTLSVWVKPSTSITSKAIVGKSEELRMVTNGSGQPLCQIKSDGVWQTAATSSEALTVGEWSQVVCAYDRTTMRVFVDGLVKGEQALTVAPDDTSSVFEIGHDASSGSGYGYYSGLVDNYRFFTYAMGTDDAKREFNNGKSMRLGSSGSTSGTGAPTNAASGEYCVPGDTTSCAPPVLEMKMDEKVAGDAKTLNDTSGNGNNGTSNDGANNTGMDCSKPGKFGSGCEFDGVDDYVAKNDTGASVLDISDQITISASIKIKGNALNAGDWKVIIMKGASTHPGVNYSLIVFGTPVGKEALGFYYQNAGDQMIISPGVLEHDKWYHVSAVYNDQLNKIELFINGVKQNTSKPYGDPESNSLLTNDFQMVIGSQSDSSRFFNGLIDQVRIYNYARTPAQIAWEYNKGKPIAHWKFDEGSGTTLHDEGTNAYHGTIDGGVTWNEEDDCKSGRCLSFNGLNLSQVSVDAPDNMGNFTVCAWIKADGLSNPKSESEMFIFHKGWHLALLPSGTLRFRIPTSSAYPQLTTTSSLSAGQWYRACGVYGGISVQPKVYVNGVEQAGSGGAGSGTQSDDSAQVLYISSTSNEYYGNFYGSIDDPKIYNYPLTAEQIKADYNGEAMSFN